MIFLSLFFGLAFAGDFPVVKHPCPNGESYPVHLTFDDGPKFPETEQILDELKSRGIKATFFLSMSHFQSLLNGAPSSETQKMLKLVKRMKEEGHSIGSHSFDHIEHANLETVSAAEAKENFKKSDVLAKKLNLIPPIPFRFPYGSGWFQNTNPENQAAANKIMNDVIQSGYSPTHWDLDTWDWSKIKRKALPDSVLNQICSHKGGILLMHDIQSFTAKNLSSILDSIKKSNHKIVSLSEIKQYSSTKRDGALVSLSKSSAGIFACGRSKGDLDQVWPSCKEYLKKSSDIRGQTVRGAQ